MNSNILKSKVNLFNQEFKLTVMIFLFLFIFKLFVIKDLFIVLKTSIYDLIILVFIYILFNFSRNTFTKVFFNLFSIINYVVLSLYYFYFFDVSQRVLNFSNFNKDLILFVINNLISIKLVIIILIGLVLFWSVSFIIFKRNIFLIKREYLVYSFILCIIIFIILIFLFKYTANPYVDTFLKINEKPLINLDESSPYLSNLFVNDKSFLNYDSNKFKYKKIIVFLGEEWSIDSFVVEKENLLKNNFFSEVMPHSNIYLNYHTTNQDSRTAIYSMLSSYFIPFEAYTDADVYIKYLNLIKTKNNLISYLNYNDYSTQFLVSSLEVPDTSYGFNWSQVNTLNKEVYDSKEYYCPDLFTYETACEDLSVIDDFKKIVLNNDNLFLYQELIFGHSYKNIVDTKKSRTQYYNDYFTQAYDFLKDENLLDETLIIITSDHGSRAQKNMLLPEGYNIPMMFIANDLNYTENNDLLSHLDFKDLLLNYLLDSNNIINNNSIMFIGGTNTNLIGFITKSSDYGIINVSSKQLFNYNLNNDSIKNISNDYYSIYKYLQNEYN